MKKLGATLLMAMIAGSSPSMAQSVTGSDLAAWDPLENLNRAVYSFNEAFSSTAAGPLAETYREYVPQGMRSSIDNFFVNLREPLTALSSALQGDLENAGNSLGRFAINSTAGIAGLFDVATEMDWRAKPQDLGVAMCSYGVPSGPYLVLPFLGASTVRDTAGIFATYTLAYNVSHDMFPSYIVLDGAAARAEEPAPIVAGSYEMQRASYLAFREGLCSDALPAATLKASPLGKVKPIGG